MSDDSDIAARLAALSDAELIAVLRPVVAGRSRLWALSAALDELAGVHHAEIVDDVNPGTTKPGTRDAAPSGYASGQVSGGIAVPVVPSGTSDSALTGGYSSSGVPTFDSVRDKVERRFGTAQGMDELDRQTPVGRGVEEQFQAREKAARERLDRIRESLRDDG
ncbi:PspA/IM30 family protein [Nocardia bovistercoris]|uniref:PspA domain-containing protein n=1 Tax=Nocardia bovistercoris TaxID=2785916 RepID=A0A931IGR7_9NOCA|nr:hypothetical protein [Nocardia bovistercoris]MBH0780283.1 hypothetical protein [Nocardia bovistercoris]